MHNAQMAVKDGGLGVAILYHISCNSVS